MSYAELIRAGGFRTILTTYFFIHIQWLKRILLGFTRLINSYLWTRKANYSNLEVRLPTGRRFYSIVDLAQSCLLLEIARYVFLLSLLPWSSIRHSYYIGIHIFIFVCQYELRWIDLLVLQKHRKKEKGLVVSSYEVRWITRGDASESAVGEAIFLRLVDPLAKTRRFIWPPGPDTGVPVTRASHRIELGGCKGN